MEENNFQKGVISFVLKRNSNFFKGNYLYLAGMGSFFTNSFLLTIIAYQQLCFII